MGNVNPAGTSNWNKLLMVWSWSRSAALPAGGPVFEVGRPSWTCSTQSVTMFPNPAWPLNLVWPSFPAGNSGRVMGCRNVLVYLSKRCFINKHAAVCDTGLFLNFHSWESKPIRRSFIVQLYYFVLSTAAVCHSVIDCLLVSNLSLCHHVCHYRDIGHIQNTNLFIY